MPTDLRTEADAALAAFDRALAKKPERDGHAFTDLTEHLCALRDLLIAHRRAGTPDDQSRLERLNAIISSSLAGHFPLGKAPWPELEQARTALQTLQAEL